MKFRKRADSCNTMSEDEISTSHLCNNYRHLLMAMADIALTGQKALLIYLEDDLPLHDELRQRLLSACPEAEFLFTTDADEIAAFSQLPRWFPPIVRRNLRFGGPLGLVTPHSYGTLALRGRHFERGYVYHSGFHTAKSLVSHCDEIVLREGGTHNYVTHTIPWAKALLRGFAGRRPRYRVWGDEPWIDRIQVALPEELPQSVRAKASRIEMTELLTSLPENRSRALARAFLETPPPSLRDADQNALLLTQPLDQAGICSFSQQKQFYELVIQMLHDKGYRVFHKPHPRETPCPLPNTEAVPAQFPIEAWPFAGGKPFDLAVTAFSSALKRSDLGFAKIGLQLIPVEAFKASEFSGWPPRVTSTFDKLNMTGRPTTTESGDPYEIG